MVPSAREKVCWRGPCVVERASRASSPRPASRWSRNTPAREDFAYITSICSGCLRPGDPLEPLGWDDLVGVPGFVLLEWADRAGDQQPADRWEVKIDYAREENERTVEVRRLGRAEELVAW